MVSKQYTLIFIGPFIVLGIAQLYYLASMPLMYDIGCIICNQKTHVLTPVCLDCQSNAPNRASANGQLQENRDPICNKQESPYDVGMYERSNLNNTIHQNIASNIVALENPESDQMQKKFTDFPLHKDECVQYDENLACPKPSGNHYNTNMSEEKSPNGSTLKARFTAPKDPKTLTCHLCMREIDRHRIKQGENIVYKCCICEFTDDQAYRLQCHFENYPLRCDICKEIKWENPFHGKQVTCKLCCRTFQCQTLLEKHLFEQRKSHYGENCIVCNKEIAAHFDEQQKKSYYCCCCPKRFETMDILRNHLYDQSDLRIFKCDVCDKRYKKSRILQKHLFTHFRCRICGKKCSDDEILESHYSEKHQSLVESENVQLVDDNLAIPGTSRSRSDVNLINISSEKTPHEAQSIPPKDVKKLICHICKWEICRHIMETKEHILYKCCGCQYRIGQQYKLRDHIENHPLRCDICDEIKWENDAHEKEEACELCPKIFQCKTLLEKHSFEEHMKHYEKNCILCKSKISEHIDDQEGNYYCCCSCTKVYSKEHFLQSHLFSHFSIELYKCDVCDKRFKQNESLESHLSKHFHFKTSEKRCANSDSPEVHTAD